MVSTGFITRYGQTYSWEVKHSLFPTHEGIAEGKIISVEVYDRDKHLVGRVDKDRYAVPRIQAVRDLIFALIERFQEGVG